MSQEAKKLQAAVDVMGPSSPTVTASKGYRIIETEVFGTVLWFNFKEGYGFIKRADTEKDIFLHHTAIRSTQVQKRRSGVGDGEVVKFDVVEGRNGPQAANITFTTQNNLVTKKDLSEVHLKLKEQRAHIHKELEAAKSLFSKHLTDMKKAYSTDLQATEAKYLKQLEAQQARKENEDRKARLNEKLEAQEALFNKEKASKMGDGWVYVFGGVCVFIVFLSAKCLTK